MACGWQNSCRPWSCNYLQNAGATTYKNFLQFYAKKACKKQCLNDKKKTIIAKRSFDKSVDALEMEKEISQVLEALSDADPTELPTFQYTPVEVKQKIPNDKMLFSKVWTNVVQYFPFVEDKLKQLNNERRLTYEKISGDVKRAYLEFATDEQDKEVIFNRLCEWLAEKAQTDKKSACEAIISYYIQNCEVFERETTE